VDGEVLEAIGTGVGVAPEDDRMIGRDGGSSNPLSNSACSIGNGPDSGLLWMPGTLPLLVFYAALAGLVAALREG
jgi:hypothetical protein